MDSSTQIETFQEFIDANLKANLLESSRKEDGSLKIDFSNLSKFNVELCEDLLASPENVIKAAEFAIEKFDVQKKIKVRFFNLPDSSAVPIGNLRARHLSRFIRIVGVIRTKTPVRPQVVGAKFECPSCGNIINIQQDDNTYQKPTKCSCGRKGKFKLLDQTLIDAQKLTIEEAHEDLDSGTQPKRIDLMLLEDLSSPWTDKRTNPGTKVLVTGFLKEVPVITKAGSQSITFNLVLMANHIEPVEEDFTEITMDAKEIDEIKTLSKDPEVYKKLIESLAPSIYGHERIKEALAFQLFGGVRKVREDGVVTRGDTHMLLIGDPGSGKCLHGDSKIVLKDGSIKKISEIEEENSPSEKYAGYYVPSSSLEVHGFDEDCKHSIQTVSKVWKREEKDKLILIRTASGAEIKTTKEHPFFTTNLGLVYGTSAKNLKLGDHIATPRFLNIKGETQILPNDFEKCRAHAKNHRMVPTILDKDLARLLGYLVGDGYISYTKTSGTVSLTNNSDAMLNDFEKIINSKFGLDCHFRNSHKGKSAKESYCHSKDLINLLKSWDANLLEGSAGKGIPQIINKSNNSVLKEFIRAYFDCDSHINPTKDEIEITSKNKNLIEDLKTNLLRFGIISRMQLTRRAASNGSKIKRDYYRLTIGGEFAEIYCREIGFNLIEKSKIAEALILKNKNRNTNTDIVPNIHGVLKMIKSEFGLTEKEFGIARTTFQHFMREDRNPSRRTLQKISAKINTLGKKSLWTEILDQVSKCNIFWDEIIEIKEIDHDGLVYDFEIEKTHNFVSNAIMIHNSQLIKRMAVVAPKSRYVSGKGVTGAGLVASVVRDEFTGSWALEAGAMVLANKGFCFIDEMDKMNKEDRDAMHEGLEQQSYHYDFELMFEDGTTQKIGKFVDELMEKNKARVMKGKNCEILRTKFSKRVLSTDFVFSFGTNIHRISRHTAPKEFYKINYSNGRSITVTPEHPVFINSEGNIKTIIASEVRKGMLAPAPRGIKPVCKEEMSNDENLGIYLGLQCSEGHTYKSIKHRYAEIGITNANKYVNDLAFSTMQSVFNKTPNINLQLVSKSNNRATKDITTTRILSNSAYAQLSLEMPELMHKAPYKRVPNLVKCGSLTLKQNFLRGFFLGDGFVDAQRTGYCTSSSFLAQDLQQLLLENDVYSYITQESRQDRKYYKIVVSGKDSYMNFLSLVPDKDDRKARIRKLLLRSHKKLNDRDIIPREYLKSLADLSREFKTGLSRSISTNLSRNQNAHRETCKSCLREIENRYRTAQESFSTEDVTLIRESCFIELKEISEEVGCSIASVYNYESKDHTKYKDLLKIIKSLANEKLKQSHQKIMKLKTVLDGDFRFVKILSVEQIENKDQLWTYDVTIEPNHTFISQNLVLHNTASISKANIQATLRCETTVLAAANPKFGRFDPYLTISEQIDMPASLISRFDLIFPVKDLPNKEKDEKMSLFILKLHQNKPENRPEPPIKTELLRKYIAFARQNCFPILTDNAIKDIQKYYVEMRTMGGGSNKSVAISTRQLEGIIRLAEASARVRLSKEVSTEDTKRAIDLTQYCLTEIALDKETGKIDIDKIASGISSSERGKILNIREIINELEQRIGRIIPIEDITREAEIKGIQADKVEEAIEKLKRSGDIFEPRAGYISKL